MIKFVRESSEHITICTGDIYAGDFEIIEGHWMCTLHVRVDRVAFEGILKRMQQLQGPEPPYYLSDYIYYMGVDVIKHKFKLSNFVRVESTQEDGTQNAIIIQSDDHRIQRLVTINTKEDILGAVEYGKKRILTKGTSSGS